MIPAGVRLPVPLFTMAVPMGIPPHLQGAFRSVGCVWSGAAALPRAKRARRNGNLSAEALPKEDPCRSATHAIDAAVHSRFDPSRQGCRVSLGSAVRCVSLMECVRHVRVRSIKASRSARMRPCATISRSGTSNSNEAPHARQRRTVLPAAQATLAAPVWRRQSCLRANAPTHLRPIPAPTARVPSQRPSSAAHAPITGKQRRDAAATLLAPRIRNASADTPRG